MTHIRRQGNLIACEVIGDGPAIILLHRVLCSSAMWQHRVKPLAVHNRVINIDCQGHGASSPVSRAFTLYDMVDDVLAVLDTHATRRATWAGLSIGGMIALRAALHAPERVSALVLADTNAGSESFWKRLKYSALGSGDLASLEQPAAVTKAMLQFLKRANTNEGPRGGGATSGCS